MQIYVKTAGETTITLNVQKSHTINHVKAVIQERLYHPMKVQRLTYEGVQLEDGMTLGHYNIQNNSTLHLEEETKKEKKSFVGLEGEKEAKEAKEKDVPFFQFFPGRRGGGGLRGRRHRGPLPPREGGGGEEGGGGGSFLVDGTAIFVSLLVIFVFCS